MQLTNSKQFRKKKLNFFAIVDSIYDKAEVFWQKTKGRFFVVCGFALLVIALVLIFLTSSTNYPISLNLTQEIVLLSVGGFLLASGLILGYLNREFNAKPEEFFRKRAKESAKVSKRIKIPSKKQELQEPLFDNNAIHILQKMMLWYEQRYFS